MNMPDVDYLPETTPTSSGTDTAGTVTVQIMDITPTLARDWLVMNSSNRPFSSHYTDKLARAMEQGYWKFNGDAIRFDGEVLIDGQHRLMAVLKSNVTIRSVVIDGVDPKAFDTIDLNRRRGGADTLALMGVKNYTAVASALVIVNWCLSGLSRSTPAIDNVMLERLLEAHPGIIESVSFVLERRRDHFFPPQIASGLHYLFSQKNHEKADTFFHSLLTSERLDAGSPVKLLHNRMVELMGTRTRIHRYYAVCLTIKAWNAFVTGRLFCALRYVDRGPKAEPPPIIRG